METPTLPTPEIVQEISSLLKRHGWPLSYSYRDANRMNLQHYLWRETLQFNIHNSILPHLISGGPHTPHKAPPLNIADIACGTGSWLIDTAREWPRSQLDGFDVSLDIAPNSQRLPSNITLRKWDFFTDPVPSELEGKYDLIHLRWLTLRLSGKDHETILQKFHCLLKPGGYIQWEEWDYAGATLEKISPTLDTPTLAELKKMWDSDIAVSDLPRLLWEVGFRDLVVERIEERNELVHAFQELHLMNVEEAAGGVMRLKETHMGASLFPVIITAHQEFNQGTSWRIPMIVVVMRKDG
ncbi:S-adenosyl-L-methionine-dependent methyltransferase [Aspergillus granulosus]|uniref:S-adenosyl-L-methionine-dependent methyltransferase n=1 Tax=Aspergillus granulosus TaxID=176169 RepID=A0ABR4HXG1_9EURO